MPIRLLQWNVWYQESADKVIDQLREVDADVLCLQELTTTSKHNPDVDIPGRIASELRYASHFLIANAWDTTPELRRTLGNGIFSRLPMKATRTTFVRERNDNTPDYSREGRTYLEADLETPAGPLTVGTTHLSYTHEFADTPQKDEEVSNLITAATKHQERLIVTGDLNALPESRTIQRMQEVLRHCGPEMSVTTWTTKPFNHGGFVADHLGWRLDYAFATPDLRILAAEAVPTDVSDHLPLLITFELP